jgi:hypothetical protein
MEVRTIGGQRYTPIQTQRSGIAVYRGETSYLRIGEQKSIERYIAIHDEMECAGFPVARALKRGKEGDLSYFVEKSLGEKRFVTLFEEDTNRYGHASDEHLDKLIDITSVFLRAQCASIRERDEAAFARAVRLEILCEELPHHAERIRATYTATLAKLKDYPFVLIHGDFNPANVYPEGVIDLEDSSVGPIGYDTSCVMLTHEWFPISGDYEYRARYIFTDEQQTRFADSCDGVLASCGMPRASDAAQQFMFLRAIWLTAGMSAWPKLQKYRYDLFISRYLS